MDEFSKRDRQFHRALADMEGDEIAAFCEADRAMKRITAGMIAHNERVMRQLGEPEAGDGDGRAN